MARRWKALLIQDVLDYSEILLPIIQAVIYQSGYKINPSRVLEWIIREEIGNTYYLFDQHHVRGQHPQTAIYHHVRQHVKYDLSVMTAQHIKAPPLYGDNCMVDICLTGRDLYIAYNK